LGIASGATPGQIGTCTWPGEGCQTAARTREWAYASTNKKITRIGLCLVSMEVVGFDVLADEQRLSYAAPRSCW
jgi:hypothetical protein